MAPVLLAADKAVAAAGSIREVFGMDQNHDYIREFQKMAGKLNKQ